MSIKCDVGLSCLSVICRASNRQQAQRHSARMSKITCDGFTRFIVRLVYFSVIDVLYVYLQYFDTVG